jgi:hypothetical protein
MVKVCTNSHCSLRSKCGKALKGEIDPTLKSHYQFVFIKPSKDKAGRVHCGDYVRV